ncbi:GIY-YIG nuclease family protein [Rickettsia endosymbiont of Halotydeus destructor]|uniref:GIY-YIG nuclease family protein n=1 Tax=Rickettsia endosymbiont of Halotydeus destructor TaxID=2996754 RepID=UPI003BAF804C
MYWVYILCSDRNGTLYIGITNNILRRTYEHKHKAIKGFTAKYNVIKLVYTEEFADIKEALAREKVLKKWNRGWKIKLIEKINPDWKDLGKDFSGFPPSREGHKKEQIYG